MNSLENTLNLLKSLISIPSFSKEEDGTADLLENYLHKNGIPTNRKINNVWAVNKYFDENKPSILLNSHHDTVKPNVTYTNNPFIPVVEKGKLFGLGSNDAGAPLVSLLSAFINFYADENLNYNIIFAATGEEEISGKNGIECILNDIGKIDFGIIGEPTNLNVAIAEKGLMVIDCVANGVAGHAARNEGVNAIYIAMEDITWFKTFRFPKVSETLGEVKMSVTIISSGEQHNVVPASCKFTVDIRTTDAYTNEKVLSIIKENTLSEIIPRSLRLNSSHISIDHPLVTASKKLNLNLYGSPTLSDQALLHFPTIKIGPGDSARSHTANEFVFIEEIEQGINTYTKILQELNLLL